MRRPLEVGTQHVVLQTSLAPVPRHQLLVGRIEALPGGRREWRARGYFFTWARGKRRVGMRHFNPDAERAGVSLYKGLVPPGLDYSGIVRRGALLRIPPCFPYFGSVQRISTTGCFRVGGIWDALLESLGTDASLSFRSADSPGDDGGQSDLRDRWKEEMRDFP